MGNSEMLVMKMSIYERELWAEFWPGLVFCRTTFKVLRKH